MKKLIFVIIFFAFIFAGCKNSSSNSAFLADEDNINSPQTTSQNKVSGEKNDKLCGWIDDSDFVIKLDLPEEYAHYNDANISPSYETGFIFKSSYGDIAYSQMLARKGCDYRVGFNKEDFANINNNPNYPFIISIRKDSSTDFSYDDEPMKITLKDGLPEQGNEFIIKINGEVPSFNHYDAVFKQYP